MMGEARTGQPVPQESVPRLISNAIRKRTSELRELLMDIFSPFVTQEITATDLADQFLICIEGSIVLARIYDDPAYLRCGLNQFRRCLEKLKSGKAPM